MHHLLPAGFPDCWSALVGELTSLCSATFSKLLAFCLSLRMCLCSHFLLGSLTQLSGCLRSTPGPSSLLKCLAPFPGESWVLISLANRAVTMAPEGLEVTSA
jgi:hypothetical protein